MGIAALLTDLYFWAGFVLFILSVAGIFWILKSLQTEPEEMEAEPAPMTLENLAKQITLIEESIAKIEKRFHEQNSDQMNEMAGQMKLMVQMLKVIQGGGGSESVALVNQKVDKIYSILSTLSQTELK